MRHVFLAVVLFSLPGWAGLCGCAGEDPTRRPTAVRNVVLISIDTCRVDRLGCYNQSLLKTPHIDRLASEGTLFTRARATNPLTLPSHSSMLTGTTPLYHRVHDNSNYRLAERHVTLSELLREQGLKTAAFVGAVVIEAKSGLSQGFDLYDDEMPKEGMPRAGWNLNERRGDAVSAAAIEWLDENHEDPFFMFVHYFDPHQAYQPPEPWLSRYKNDLYTGEVVFTDHCIGQLLDHLDSLGLADNTLVILTSDHGESFGEHGEMTHSFFAYETTMQVPFIVRSPGQKAAMRVDEPVSIVDVAPTVLGQLGLDAPDHMQGDDLSPLLTDEDSTLGKRFIYCESTFPTRYGCSAIRGLSEGDWKYLHSVRHELYDLASDPQEANNVIAGHRDIAQRLEVELRARFAAREPLDEDEGTKNLAQDDVARLRTLGYLGGGQDDGAFDAKANDIDPKDFVAHHNRLSFASGAFAAHNFPAAEKACLEVLGSGLQVADTHSILGMVYRAQGRHADAEVHFKKYLDMIAQRGEDTADQGFSRLDANILDVMVQLGGTLVALGRFDEAIEHLTNALEFNAENAPTYWNLGQAYRGKKNPAKAVAAFREAVRLDPGDENYAVALAATLETSGDIDAAIDAYHQCLAVFPELDRAYFGLGRALVARGDLEQGREQLLRAGRRYKRAAYEANNLAWKLASTPNVSPPQARQALLYANVAIELDQDARADFFDTLAVAQAAAGEYAEAIATTQRALEMAGDDDPEFVAALRGRLALYERGEAYSETPDDETPDDEPASDETQDD
ncbi:MAG: tetratricopeptide repeat protein [Planctomycetota bacterium]|nr:MAG: tetratricopeptide repeat protein [Planctomycetota bacterium]